MRKSTYITNLGECMPAEAVSRRWENGCWRSVDYETVDGIVGQMLMATTMIDPPPVSIPLNVKGWYRVYLGLGCPNLVVGSSSAIKVKLSDDPCYSTYQTTGRYWWMEFEEILWREADLTGKTLEIAKPNGIHNGGPEQVQSYIGYVRLEPLSDLEVEAIKKHRNEPTDYNIVATADGWSIIAIDHPTTLEELYEPFLPYKDSDIRTIHYCAAAGDYVNYPDTKVGTASFLNERPIYPRPLDKAWDDSMEVLRAKGIDPVGAICDFVHNLGLEFHGNVRTGSFACDPPFDEYYDSKFYIEHPEFRCKDKDGREIPRLSYAYPEVQKHMIELYCEIARHNLDGFGWIFIRSLPVILYEQPLIDGFMEKYGEDPRKLPEDDERVTQFRADMVTNFLLAAKAELEKLRIKQNRPPMKYSAIVPANERVNRLGGLDVRRWACEKIVDTLAVDFSIQDRNSLHNEAPSNIELEYFQDVVSGTDCKFAPRLGYFEDERGIQMIKSLDDMGITSGLIWDVENCCRFQSYLWPLVRYYGNRDMIRHWAAAGKKPEHVYKPLRTLGGYTMDKFPGNLAY